MPVTWREVTDKLDPQAFTIHTVPARIAKLKADPWAGFGDARQSLVAPLVATPAEKKRKHG